MSIAIPFVAALFATLFVGAVARLLAKFVTSDRPARLGAFCVAIGFAVGRFSFSGTVDSRALPPIAAVFGAAVALTILWLWLVKQRGADQLLVD